MRPSEVRLKRLKKAIQKDVQPSVSRQNPQGAKKYLYASDGNLARLMIVDAFQICPVVSYRPMPVFVL